MAEESILDAAGHASASILQFKSMQVNPRLARALDLFVHKPPRRIPDRNTSAPSKGHADQAQAINDDSPLDYLQWSGGHDLEDQLWRRYTLENLHIRKERETLPHRKSDMSGCLQNVFPMRLASVPNEWAGAIYAGRLTQARRCKQRDAPPSGPGSMCQDEVQRTRTSTVAPTQMGCRLSLMPRLYDVFGRYKPGIGIGAAVNPPGLCAAAAAARADRP